MIVVGVDPDTKGCYWFWWDGKTGAFESHKTSGLTEQAKYWNRMFATAPIGAHLAIEDQYLHPKTPNFKAIKQLILARGICEGAYRHVVGQDPIVVHPKTWQSAVGCSRTDRRDICEATAQGFTETILKKQLPNQHVIEAACIAITTWDKLRCGDLASGS